MARFFFDRLNCSFVKVNGGYTIIYDEHKYPVGVYDAAQIGFYYGTRVQVTPDSHGYIGEEIKTPGPGTIVRIWPEEYGDSFFEVRMDNGEHGVLPIKRLSEFEQ